ncbi:hypothetical protein FNH22_26470 [Fulvivirga sp. M361]|uniref:hypothetical protein n=1 Tax=Fulvivirga sp. M361 TaxID=2594266 RepID=UPI00117B7318|nr:hypothetical protein [Fulvivirga sp. M361]TRX49852.1 hypothetical protein FNH22_26470 [Fulvivirga sp. M361]
MYKQVVVSAMILMLVVPGFLKAQKIEANGYFLEDSIKIGISTPFILTARYPRNQDIVFPDSLYDFSPYELEEKWYTATLSNDSLSYDSAVYYLSSFEIDSIQYYQMPVFLLAGTDSIILKTERDSIFLQHVVAEIPDSLAAETLPLKENTTYKRVALEFNYPYLFIGGGIVLAIIILVIILFGKPIRKKIILRRLSKAHQKFLERYDAATSQSSPDAEKAEHVLGTWKKYLEKLENRPYTKSTSKEIIQKYKSEDIKMALQGLDRAIYAAHTNSELAKSFEDLKRFSEKRFHDKLMEVKNG